MTRNHLLSSRFSAKATGDASLPESSNPACGGKVERMHTLSELLYVANQQAHKVLVVKCFDNSFEEGA